MSEIQRLINIANDEIGYLEKSRQAYNENPEIIYDKVAGAGRDNITKYAKEMDELEVYNTPKQGYAWCKVFVDWCMVNAFGEDRATQLLYGWTAGVTQAYTWFRNNGQIATTPKVGDLIIFGNCDHIGIVVDYDDSTVYTIEGNTSGATGLVANGGGVAQKSYSRWSSYIKCYARPEYEDEPEPTPEPPTPTPSGDEQIRDIQLWINEAYGLNVTVDGYYGPQTKDALVTAYQMELNENYGADLVVDGDFGRATKNATPILSLGDENDLVGLVQSMLYCRGYYLANGVSGEYDESTQSAIRTYQSNHNLSPDGIYGPNTGYSLFN